MYYIMKSQLLTNENGELLAEIENYNEIGEIWSWS